MTHLVLKSEVVYSFMYTAEFSLCNGTSQSLIYCTSLEEALVIEKCGQ